MGAVLVVDGGRDVVELDDVVDIAGTLFFFGGSFLCKVSFF